MILYFTFNEIISKQLASIINHVDLTFIETKFQLTRYIEILVFTHTHFMILYFTFNEIISKQLASIILLRNKAMLYKKLLFYNLK